MTLKTIVKKTLNALHRGAPPGELGRRIETEIGTPTLAELLDVEQALVEEGFSPQTVTLLWDARLIPPHCNGKTRQGERPVALLRSENALIRGLLNRIRRVTAAAGERRIVETRRALDNALHPLGNVRRHYRLEEETLLPLLEARGFPGPSRLMRQRHAEVCRLYDDVVRRLAAPDLQTHWPQLRDGDLYELLDEMEGLIVQEERLLIPVALQRLSNADWARVSFAIESAGPSFAGPSRVARRDARKGPEKRVC